MSSFIKFILIAYVLVGISDKIYAQPDEIHKEFGIMAGAFGNFPASKDYLDKNIKSFYIAPYIRAGRHEFLAGLLYPLKTDALFYPDSSINSRPGFTAGYKFYIFNPEGRENLFIHYSFQYLRFKGTYGKDYGGGIGVLSVTEKDMYINNVIGLGYHIFFDMNGRFGLYYILDYVISQTGYKTDQSAFSNDMWRSDFIWNNLSSNVGFIFKLMPIKSKVK
jgi:hypothetical protein